MQNYLSLQSNIDMTTSLLSLINKHIQKRIRIQKNNHFNNMNKLTKKTCSEHVLHALIVQAKLWGYKQHALFLEWKGTIPIC